jgi:hypothetical protein
LLARFVLGTHIRRIEELTRIETKRAAEEADKKQADKYSIGLAD